MYFIKRIFNEKQYRIMAVAITITGCRYRTTGVSKGDSKLLSSGAFNNLKITFKINVIHDFSLVMFQPSFLLVCNSPNLFLNTKTLGVKKMD